MPLMALGIVSAAAFAQQAPEVALEKIEITGSNIKRADVVTTENVQVISAEDIKRSGQPTVADYLRTVSANFASYNETSTNSFAPASSGIALRGLSQKNTLVLLNGRRITNFGFAQNLEDTFVDLNVIPANAVDRIEILKSGAAAIYGSDATAGVVNIILKQNTTERIAEAGFSATTEGGGLQRDAAISAGFGNLSTDNYTVFVAASLLKRDELLASQRSYTSAQDYRNKADGYLAWQQSGNYTDNTSSPVQTAFPTCGQNGLPGTVVNMTAYQAISSATGTTCAYNAASQISLIPGTERANLITNGTLRLSPTWTAFGDIFYSNVKTTVSETPMNLGPNSVVYNPSNGGVNSVSNLLPVGNPSNPNGTPQGINYVFQSLGGLDYKVISNTYRVSGGVKGTWMKWDWEGAYGHSENHVVQTYYNGVNAPALEAAIASGSFNFLDPLSTPAAGQALDTQFSYAAKTKLDTIGIKASGEVFALPAGAANAAVGTEFRHETMSNLTDAALTSGQILNYGIQNVLGSRSVASLFGELTIPIVKSLEADLAAREEHYGDVGNNFSPQVSLRWQPSSALTFRAVGSHGFRAPSLPEISTSSSVSFSTVADPVAGGKQVSAAVVTEGNPNLRPETSKNLDFGVVLSPTANTSLSIDYYKIFIDHVIATTATAQDIVNNPSSYPGQIFRTGGGVLEYILDPYANKFQLMTSGMDVEGSLTVPLAQGAQFHMGFNASYVASIKVNDGTQWNEYVGSNNWYWNSPIGGGGPAPRIRGSFFAGWETPSWVTQATVHYTDNYQNYCYYVQGSCPTPESANVPSLTTLDLYAEYRGVKNWRFTGAINNVFNTPPPWDWQAAPFDVTLYDARGRAVELRASYQF